MPRIHESTSSPTLAKALDFSAIDTQRRQPTAIRSLLFAVEGLLYVAFIATCFVLLASVGRSATYYPEGGGSLIVILLLVAGVHRLRCGRDHFS